METKNKKTAIVLFSGGQDSTTLLGWAKNRFETVYALSLNYGQRHAVELQQAEIICKHLGIEQLKADVSQFATLVDSNLTNAETNINETHSRLTHLPSAYVPNRNTILLTLAHSYAQKLGADAVVAGMNQTDYQGYPDCREHFVITLNHALNYGSDTNIEFITPLMHITKAQTWEMAEAEGVLDLVIKESHTCYNGKRDHFRNDGYGCTHVVDGEIVEECPSCRVRREGYEQYIKIKNNK
jgi:7-cyano-7-deazaguanine synthase